jgi:hypothetical protein
MIRVYNYEEIATNYLLSSLNLSSATITAPIRVPLLLVVTSPRPTGLWLMQIKMSAICLIAIQTSCQW